jgi:hypothetical protein
MCDVWCGVPQVIVVRNLSCACLPASFSRTRLVAGLKSISSIELRCAKFMQNFRAVAARAQIERMCVCVLPRVIKRKLMAEAHMKRQTAIESIDFCVRRLSCLLNSFSTLRARRSIELDFYYYYYCCCFGCCCCC